LQWTQGLAEGVAYLHGVSYYDQEANVRVEHLIHRDLKVSASEASAKKSLSCHVNDRRPTPTTDADYRRRLPTPTTDADYRRRLPTPTTDAND
jgi:hypothetical protein